MDIIYIMIMGLLFTGILITMIMLRKNRKKKKGKGISVQKYEKAHHLSATIYYVLMIIFFFITFIVMASVYDSIKSLVDVIP